MKSTNPQLSNRTIEALKQQQEFVFTKAKDLTITAETLKQTLEKVCLNIAEIMDCERVGIWLFDDEYTELRAQNIYDSRRSTHSAGAVLTKQSYSSYFQAIRDRRTLAVDNIQTNEATRQIAQLYASERDDICSILDASIILSRGIGGVLCCESKELRQWSSFDQMVTASIADMLSFLFDRVDRLDVEDHLHTLAYTDELTGLANYNEFFQAVSSLLSTMEAEQEGIFIYLNFDQFIEIHSVFGTDGTDRIIQAAAQRLASQYKDAYCIARIAFDHFIIFARHEGDNNAARLEPIIKELRKPILVDGQEVYLTISYGTALYPHDAADAKEGLQAARLALETAKKQSTRKSIGVYNDAMHRHMKRMMISEMNLRKGLDMNEFRLFYQPQVRCDTGEITGFEALIRWQHPERGLIFPADFIEIAESTGFIISIGEWVIEEALRQLSRLKEMGQEDLTISVNLSPRHFLHRKLPAFLQERIEQNGVNPNNLILEITESVALEQHQLVQQQMNTLTDLGFSISIDDFGTGYSAFLYLQSFSVQEIKIDRQFIMNIASDPKSEAIVRTIVQLGQLLGIRTIAEGVETAAEWKMLKSAGCDEIQGFYFAKPLNEDAIKELFHCFQQEGTVCLPK